MSWGPGEPDKEKVKALSRSRRRSEPTEECDAVDGEEEKEVSQEAQESRDERQRTFAAFEERDWRGGSTNLPLGEYAFLPVFGFNEGHVATRRHAERMEMSEDEWWEEEGNKVGRMFGDDVSEEEPTRIAGKELSWWEDESIMPKHPYLLINPVGFTTADADGRDFRDVFRLQKGNQFTFSDSGGYQLMSMVDKGAEIVDSMEEHAFQDLKVYPEELIRWQVVNADAGATIDYPPYNISGDANFPDAATWGEEWFEFFQERMGKSAEMTRRMAARLKELREEEGELGEQARDYLFCPVIHGKPHPDTTHSNIMYWHHAMEENAKSEGIDPDGWVLKPEPSHNFGQIAMFLAYAAEYLQDVDYLHVLMVGGLLQKSLIMYYASRSDQFLTSDASSYAAGGKRRQFDLPKTARRRSVIITNRTDEEREGSTLDATRLDRYPCRCQVCSLVEKEWGYGFVTEGTGSARNATLNLHNLHQALSIERTMDALLREESAGQQVETGGDPGGTQFWRFVASITDNEKRIKDLYRAMDYIRIAQDEGLDEANDIYRILWERKMGKTVRGVGSSAREW